MTKNPLGPLRILMLAPEPFFQPRGTPISIYFRLKALSSLGHHVDLVTYHLGENKRFPNITISRIPNIFGIKRIKIGPSLAKIPLDSLLAFQTIGKMIIRRYDLIFSHEEAGWIGSMLSWLTRVPHLYDMHSSLPQQLKNYEFTRSGLIIGLFHALERRVLAISRAIIVICPDLQKIVRKEGFAQKTVLLENFIDFEHGRLTPQEMQEKKRMYAADHEKLAVYTGNFQPYQGIPLLFQAMQRLHEHPVKLLLVGGGREELHKTKALASEMGLGQKVCFTGQVPPSEVPAYTAIADVLLSSRISGTNTPLKIYSFLKTGKPLVATRLWTHTQVLNDNIAILTEPQGGSFAEGIRKALFTAEGANKAQSAKAFADREYTYPRYLKIMTQALERACGQGK